MPPREYEGQVLEVECPCGKRLYSRVEKYRHEIFEWGYDNGARTTFWDVTALWEYLNMERKGAVLADLPLRLMSEFLSWNKQTGDIEADRPSVAQEGLPVLIIPHPSAVPDAVPCPFIPLDGWHRMTVAVREGRDLQCLLIESEVERKFRIHDIFHVGMAGWEPERFLWTGEGKTLLEVMEEEAAEKTLLDTKARI